MLSGSAFVLALLLGACYYMQGYGFSDSFFFHLNTDTLVIAARSYSNVFYPSLLGLLLSLLAPAIIYKKQSHKMWPVAPAFLLWVLALVFNYPIYSLASYQLSLGVEFDQPALDDEKYSEQGVEQSVTDISKSITGNAEPSAAKEPDARITMKASSAKIVENSAGSHSSLSESLSETLAIPSLIESKTLPKIQHKPQPKLKKNIILIYAESLEELYLDTEIFGDVLPNIRELSTKSHRFTNLVQVRGTEWTVGGIVASQCGFPLKISIHLAANSTMASVNKPYEDETCLVDILSENDYETVYMGGAPLWFAGKGNFLRTHGYKRISGGEELASYLPDKKYQSGWGLYDDSLFELALNELQSLEKKDQVYLLTLLTLDTHHPNGIPSKSCEKLAGNQDLMSNAIYCSDQLISSFIDEAMKIVDMKNTIIVLFSDHLSLRNTLWEKLKKNRKRRRLMFMIFDDAPATVSSIRATHFDVAPTVLEAAGFTDQLRVGAGISLFSRSPDEHNVEQLVKTESSAPSLLSPGVSVEKNGVVLSREDVSLRIGDLTLKANNKGNKFVSGMYLAVLDGKGNVIDTIFADDYEHLAKTLNGTFVIGLSVLPNAPNSATYFYGRITPDGKEITQGLFNRDVHLSATDLSQSQK